MYVFVAFCSCMRFLEKMMWSSSKPIVDLGHHQVFVILTDMSSYADALREAEVSVNCWQGRWGNSATTGCFSLSKSKSVKCDTVVPCHSPPTTWKPVKNIFGSWNDLWYFISATCLVYPTSSQTTSASPNSFRWCQVSAAREEVPGRRGYPGYMCPCFEKKPRSRGQLHHTPPSKKINKQFECRSM